MSDGGEEVRPYRNTCTLTANPSWTGFPSPCDERCGNHRPKPCRWNSPPAAMRHPSQSKASNPFCGTAMWRRQTVDELVSGFGLDEEGFGGSGEAGCDGITESIPNCGERYRPGEMIRTAFGIDHPPSGEQAIRQETTNAGDASPSPPVTAGPHEGSMSNGTTCSKWL